MLKHSDARAFSKKLSGATARVCRDHAIGDVSHEEPFSDQLCGRLKETLEDFESENVRWQAEFTTRSKGKARLAARTLSKYKEEKLFGADLVMTIEIDTPDYQIRKGFLAQAKMLEVGSAMPKGEHKRLVEQCNDMLKITPASFVFLYSSRGVHVISASAVIASTSRNLHEIDTHDILWLYHDFAICWLGDSRLQATDPQSLEALRSLAGADAAISFVGTPLDEFDAAEKRKT